MADTNSTTEQSNIEKAESVANIVQAVINSVAGYYGGNTGKAFANALTGNGGDDKLILGKDSLRHVEMNNKDFSIQKEVG